MHYIGVMAKTLELAISNAASLSDAAQGQLGRELNMPESTWYD
jgi:hypothetical protein